MGLLPARDEKPEKRNHEDERQCIGTDDLRIPIRAWINAKGDTLRRSSEPNPRWYDKPFDTAHELTRTGTTANYRMVHLQRLANPLLPWNPEPKLADGKTANPEYQAEFARSIRISRSIRRA